LDSSPDLHVALDSTGAVHFVFVDYNTGVNYATNSGGTWHSQQLESWSGTSGLVVDAEDHVSVVCSGEGLDYWTNSTGTWQKTAISGNCGVVRLAMDTHGRLVLACDDSTPTVNAPAGASLMLGYLGNAGWDLQSVWSVPTPGGVSSADVDLAIDTQDNIHIIWGFYNAPALYVTSAP
jgi:hypothetical protein